VHLVTGPPGTGKTSIIVGILSALVHDEDAKVLVCAPSNAAIDEATRRVVTSGFLDKYGNPYSINKILKLGGIDANHFSLRRARNIEQPVNQDEDV